MSAYCQHCMLEHPSLKAGLDSCPECSGVLVEECDHDFKWKDESFSHEFGTEICGNWICRKCGVVGEDLDRDEP